MEYSDMCRQIQLQKLAVAMGIIFKMALKQYDVRICTEVLWLQTGATGQVL
jgi:hypothetical protein